MRHLRVVVVLATLGAVFVVAASSGGAQDVKCFGRSVTIFATPGVVTVGTAGPDVIHGTGGDDVIRSRGGNDRVCAKGGDDRVFSGGGADKVNLGPGDDVAKDSGGNDLILGKAGRDIISGNAGNDILKGGGAFDTLVGGKHDDDLFGQGGADDLEGNGGNDNLNGGKSIDACNGGPGGDTVTSCNERVPFGANPFVGWWVSIVEPPRSPPPGAQITVSIDPAGNYMLFQERRDPTGFCFDNGVLNATLTLEHHGAQTGPTTWTGSGGAAVTCFPDVGSPVDFSLPGFNPVLEFDPVSDTTSSPDGTNCSWRRGSTAADCN
ncbi:MAG: calcium-binding protein [Acidimicrobiales bacterium]